MARINMAIKAATVIGSLFTFLLISPTAMAADVNAGIFNSKTAVMGKVLADAQKGGKARVNIGGINASGKSVNALGFTSTTLVGGAVTAKAGQNAESTINIGGIQATR